MATARRGLALAVLILGASILSANATSGPGCFYVVNVASWDVLNIRSGPSHRTTVVGTIDPNSHGIISQSGACLPSGMPLRKRWCPIAHYTGVGTTRGFVKRHFLAPSDCP